MAMDLNAKAAYIRGLMTGMDFDADSKNGKVIAAMMDLLEEMAAQVTEHDNALDQVYDELETLDQDLDDVVSDIYADEDEDGEEDAEDDSTMYEVTCPNCGSHNVRCIPYPKAEFGIWFVLWLIVAFGGYMISVFITIVGIIFWSIALVIRLKQNKLARQYVRMQCTTCGTEFDVARSELMKGGNGK